MIAARPDIIIGSWCGKKFVPAKVAARPGFAQVPAVASGFLREVKSTLILQPGPAALTDGLDALAPNRRRMGGKGAAKGPEIADHSRPIASRPGPCYERATTTLKDLTAMQQPNKTRPSCGWIWPWWPS